MIRGLSPQKSETAMNQPALRKTLLSATVLAVILWFNGCSACTTGHLEGTYVDSDGSSRWS